MLPFQFETLVAPGNIDSPGIEVSAILTNLRDVQRKPAAHCLGAARTSSAPSGGWVPAIMIRAAPLPTTLVPHICGKPLLSNFRDRNHFMVERN